MSVLRCLIVDDEPLAHRVIENFARDLPFLEIVRKCKNAHEAIDALHQNEPIDLMFLDIEMPKLSGLNLVRSLSRPPMVIFTTAYADHALESYELEAVDYLKKPFSFQRFVQALEKAQRRRAEAQSAAASPEPPAPSLPVPRTGADGHSPVVGLAEDTVFVKTAGATVRLNLAEVACLEGMGDYIKVICTKRSVVSHQTLSQWENRLPGLAFVRIHRSYIVAVAHITAIETNEIVVAGRRLPIGRAYRKALIERVGEF